MGILPNPLTIPGLTHARAEIGDIWLHYVRGGADEARTLVLLHGFPQSWLMWRLVLPDLMEAGYDKGTMAADIHALVRHLGLQRPLIVGHDRGARVARRYALDHPRSLRGVALLDILPVEHVYDTLTAAEIARRYWHWVFQVVPEIPERLIDGHEEEYLAQFFGRDPDLLARLRADGSWNEYRRCFLQPGAVAAALGDYRATYRIDLPRYRAENAAGKRLTAPALLLWGDRGNLADQPVLDIWRKVATDVRGAAISDCGHYLPEEQPAIVADHLIRFADERFG
jgi:haloacetate dehalogenase